MRKSVVLAALLTTLTAGGAAAQQGPEPPGPKVGEMAPEFTLPGATRYGLLEGPVRLSDYRGSVVVIAFFARARTSG